MARRAASLAIGLGLTVAAAAQTPAQPAPAPQPPAVTAGWNDGYFDSRFSPKLRLRSGKAKTPVGYELLISDAYLLFPERSVVTHERFSFSGPRATENLILFRPQLAF